MSPRTSTVGSRLPLVDAAEKVSGRGQFIEDFHFQGMVHARCVRSIHPFAEILSVDFSEAEKVPGFVCSLAPGEPGTARKFGVLPISQDETALPAPYALYSGAVIAAVVCEDEVSARKAASLVKVEYKVLKPVLRPKAALEKTDTPLHEVTVGGTNIHKVVEQEFGEVDSAFSDAEVIKKAEFVFHGVNHGFTEPIGCVAVPEPNGRLSLYSATQVPHYLHMALAKVLEEPMHRIRVYKPLVGGGFGGKSDPFPHEMVASLLARKCGRPVRLMFDRDEVFLNNHGRHPTEFKLSVAVSKEGTLSAIDADAEIDGGAWGSFGVVTTYYNGVLTQGPYRMEAFRYAGRRLYTNKPASGAMRGHGAVNARFALETLIDEAALELGLDPFDFRMQNALPSNTTTLNQFRITSNGFTECLEKARRASDWDSKHGKLPTGKGIGLGCGFFISGSALPIHRTRTPMSTVHLKIDMDGGVTIHSMAADIGQGSDTVLAQCVAEAIGIDMGRCRVLARDTDTAPIDLGSYSSRVTFMAGNAALRAGEAIFRKLQRACGRMTGLPAAGFRKGEGETYIHDDDATVRIDFMAALDEALAFNGALIAKGVYHAPKLGGTFKGAGAGLSPSYSYQAFVAQVDVDTETGFVRVENVWAAHDCGKALNLTAVEGQLEGSVHMGIGQALTEEMKYSGGQLINGSFLDYKIPSPLETPEMDIIVVESNDPEGPLGAKECGEGSLAPIIPAIANAIYDAVGVRIHEVPMTPERVLAALDRKAKAEAEAAAQEAN